MTTTDPSTSTARRAGLPIPFRVVAGARRCHEPVLMIGGAFQGMRALRHFARCFHDVCDVVLADLPGTGATEPLAPDRGADFLADCAVAVLEHAGIARTHVVGVSFGSAAAHALARRHPSRVARLVLIGTMSHVDRRMEAGLRRCMERLARGDRAGFARETERVLLNRARGGDIDGFAASERLLELAIRRMGDREAAQFVTNGERLLRHRRLDLGRPLAAPTLVMTGEHDHLTTPARCREVAARCGGTFVAVPRADHLLPLQRLDACAALVRAFLAGAALDRAA